jgi:hypothetical protein
MRRIALAIAIVATAWALVLGAVVVVIGSAPASYIPIVLVGGLWVVALVVSFFLLNEEGRFSRYLAIAVVALIAAAIVVDRFAAIFFTAQTPPA